MNFSRLIFSFDAIWIKFNTRRPSPSSVILRVSNLEPFFQMRRPLRVGCQFLNFLLTPKSSHNFLLHNAHLLPLLRMYSVPWDFVIAVGSLIWSWALLCVWKSRIVIKIYWIWTLFRAPSYWRLEIWSWIGGVIKVKNDFQL